MRCVVLLLLQIGIVKCGKVDRVDDVCRVGANVHFDSLRPALQPRLGISLVVRPVRVGVDRDFSGNFARSKNGS